MRILQGTVVGGRVVVDDDSLIEGTKVTIVDESDEEPHRLSAEEEAALAEGDAEITRGNYVTAEQLLAEIQRARS